jgi:Phage tail protein RIFT-related domain
VLTAVNVINAVGDSLVLSILDNSNGYTVREITGLDPVNATLTSSSMAQIDGAQFQNARRDTRNIVIKLGLDPDYSEQTVASLRSNLYNYLMPKENITLQFEIDGNYVYTCAGQVETFENAMFSADPEIDISILCYDPDFYFISTSEVDVETVDGTVQTAIDYPGTSDTGFIFSMTLTDDLPDGFALYNTPPANENQSLVIEASLLTGDIVTVNTIQGQKSITLNRAGNESSLLYALQIGYTWLFFHKGVNYFRASADAEDPIPGTIIYTSKFGGI